MSTTSTVAGVVGAHSWPGNSRKRRQADEARDEDRPHGEDHGAEHPVVVPVLLVLGHEPAEQPALSEGQHRASGRAQAPGRRRTRRSRLLVRARTTTTCVAVVSSRVTTRPTTSSEEPRTWDFRI